MRFFQKILTASFAFTIIGCGEDQLQYIQNFRYDIEENQVALEAEFNSNVSLNTDLIVPVLDYGEVSMIANNDQYGFRLGARLNMDALLDPEIIELSRTRKLPNNQPMSPYIETDVGRLRIRDSGDVTASVYFGLEPEKFYLGVAVELNFIDEQFPAGLVLSQRIRDKQGRMLAVVSLYGPEVRDHELIAPGGLFIISNISDLQKYLRDQPDAGHSVRLMYEKDTFVNKKSYQPLNKQYELLQLYRKSGKFAGYVD